MTAANAHLATQISLSANALIFAAIIYLISNTIRAVPGVHTPPELIRSA